MNFLEFLDNNKDRFLDVVKRATLRLPRVWNVADNRYQISNYICSIIAKSFPEISMKFGRCYDLVYEPQNETISVVYEPQNETISVKIGHRLIPARTINCKSGYRKPNHYILKNTNSEAKGKELTFDYLMGIQKEEHERQMKQTLVWPTAVGVVDFASIKNDIIEKNKGAQLCVKIDDITKYKRLLQTVTENFDLQRNRLAKLADQTAESHTDKLYDTLLEIE